MEKGEKGGGPSSSIILFSLNFPGSWSFPELFGPKLVLPLFFQQFVWGKGLLC